jgi:hypothetical protein
VVDTALAAGTATGLANRRLTPEQVAEAVLGVALRPRFEVWVPGRTGIVSRLAALLPQRAQDAVLRALVPNQLSADSLARLAYESSAFYDSDFDRSDLDRSDFNGSDSSDGSDGSDGSDEVRSQ